MAQTLAEQVAIEETSPGHYVSKALPERMGNALPIAYGGYTLGFATAAAYDTVDERYSLYSMLGHFLGPASTKVPLHCVVHNTRDTRTFATRRVQVSQAQPDGSQRVCMELLLDFQTPELALLTYSAPPMGGGGTAYSPPDRCINMAVARAAAVARGALSAASAERLRASFEPMERFFDGRPCPEGISGQNLAGYLKAAATTQDDRPITAKTSADWVRARHALPTRGARMAAVAFMIDGAISFTPLSHNHMWFEDTAACSTLDFALRLFAPDIDLSAGWHLRERTTTAASHGRSYSEARVWDEHGTMLVSMTQQCILRPNPNAAPSAKSNL
jgi:acyl-CoA thioesterase II